MFAIARRVNNVYPMEFKVITPRLAAWMESGRRAELTRQELVERLEGSR